MASVASFCGCKPGASAAEPLPPPIVTLPPMLPVAAECTASYLHGAGAGGAPGAIRGDEGAAADRRGAGISARAEERDDAAFYLDAVEIGNRCRCR